MLLDHKRVYDEEGEPHFDEEVTDELQQLAEIVCNNHFSYVGYHDREDLIYEGLAKGIELIRSKRFDPNYGAPLMNFVYTGMRNEMTNYLYAKKREYPVEEFYGDQDMSTEIIIDGYNVECEWLESVTENFKRRWGDYTGILIDSLKDMGFNVKGNTKRFDRIKKYKNSLLNKLVVLAIWKIREYYH